jgi:hypothetical protein
MVGMYEITREGRPVSTGLFKSLDEILDHVRGLPSGVYDVHKELPRDPNGVRNSEYWGQLTKHETGEVTYSPVQNTEPVSMP